MEANAPLGKSAAVPVGVGVGVGRVVADGVRLGLGEPTGGGVGGTLAACRVGDVFEGVPDPC